MALDKETINNIQKSADIVDIIGSYIPLEKKGKNYFGLCPFHDDSNPSMSVNKEKGIYTCFVCHATGNVFSFVKDYENVSFVEAVKIVADKIGIEVDAGYKVISKYERFYEMLDFASKLYQNNLKSEDGKLARDYLKKRGLNDEIINEFNIGLAPSNYDTVTKLLLSKQYTETELINAGISNKGNTLYDLFRNRITFPIHNASGRCVGFSARIFDNSNEAKYINTKETAIFKKGEILFNYHRAINEAKKMKYLLLVEGQMDAIRVYASGIKNVCATMGTALTNDHIKLLKKLNVPIILCMDNDSAGEKASILNGEALSKEIKDIKVLRLSGEKDPDEYILKNGVDKFIDAINNAVTYFDFKLNVLKNKRNLNKVDDISKYINDVISELNKSNDDVLINLTINKLSEEYNIDKNILLNKIIKVEPVKVSVVKKSEKKKLDKNKRLAGLLLYYMMNETKYIELYNKELSYIPDELFLDIANDILAFYLKYNYINIADFITNEIDTDYYEEVLNIIDEYMNEEINDADFIGIINKMKIWCDEIKIEELKMKLKMSSDINEKLKLTDEIASMKKRMCNNEKN